MTDINALFSALRVEQDGLERDDLLNTLEGHVERLREDLRRADDLADQAWKALPREFALSPSDGGGVETHHAITDMAAEIERLRADNARLRTLVQGAYNEGFSEGMREHTSSRGGKPWMDSRARTAMEASNGK